MEGVSNGGSREGGAQLNIHKAAFRGNLSRIQLLLEADPTLVHSQDTNGSTALHHAAYKGHYDCAKFLLERGANVDSLDKDVCTPLHNASFTGKKKIVELLIGKGAKVDHRDVDKATPLHKACFAGQIDCARILVEAGCDFNLGDNEGITAIQKATYNDHFKCLEYLIEKGAKVNSADHKGSTTLHKAAFNGNLQCVQILLSKGVDANSKDHEDTTPLHNAVYNGHTEVVHALVHAGADINCHTTKYKSTPIHFAAFNGYLDCIKLLLEKGAYIDSRDIKKMTPLHYAVKREHEDCVEYLIECGADVSAKDYKDRTWKQMTNSKKIAGIFSGERKASLRRDFRQTNAAITNNTAQQLAAAEQKLQQQQEEAEENSKPISNGHGAVADTVVNNNHGNNNTTNTTTTTTNNHNNNTTNITTTTTTNIIKEHDNTSGKEMSAAKEQNNVNRQNQGVNGGLEKVDGEVQDLVDLEIYAKLDRNGFLVTEDTADTDNHEQVRLEMERAMKWTKMISKWDSVIKKDGKKIKVRCEKGIPARVRGQVWKLLARSTIEQLPVRKMTDYKELLLEESSYSKQIQIDINRTFPKNILLMQRGGQQALFNVLKACTVYNKKVGYIQGMGFVTALLLMYMEEEDAFWTVSQLTTVYEMGDLWKEGTPGLQKSSFILEQLLDAYLPKVYQHLQNEMVSTTMFTTQWFITVYLYNLPFPIVLRIWDIFLYEGFHFVYAVALALFKLYETELLALSFEDLFSFLQFNNNRKDAAKIDVEQLLKIANGVKDKIKRSIKNYEAEYEKLKEQTGSAKVRKQPKK